MVVHYLDEIQKTLLQLRLLVFFSSSLRDGKNVSYVDDALVHCPIFHDDQPTSRGKLQKVVCSNSDRNGRAAPTKHRVCDV